MRSEATLTSKGQITVPKGVRERLGIKAGGKVIFIVEEGEAIMLPKPKNALESLRKLRKHVKFTEEEVEGMIKESKKAWGE